MKKMYQKTGWGVFMGAIGIYILYTNSILHLLSDALQTEPAHSLLSAGCGDASHRCKLDQVCFN